MGTDPHRGGSGPRASQLVFAPSPGLRPYASGYVGFELSGFPPGVHLGPPGRTLTLLVNLSEPIEVVRSGEAATRHDALVGGLRSTAAAIRHDGCQHGVRVALTPLGARAVLGVPAGELADRMLDLDAVVGPVAAELVDRVRSATTWPARIAALEAGLAALVRRHDRAAARAVPAEVAEAWRRLVARRGQVRVADLAAALGWSRQHLGDRFRRELGLGPKTLARVLRFAHAYELVTADDPRPWAEVAALAGYADQAHLVREWRAVTGLPPTAWQREEVLPPDARPVTEHGAPSPGRG